MISTDSRRGDDPSLPRALKFAILGCAVLVTFSALAACVNPFNAGSSDESSPPIDDTDDTEQIAEIPRFFWGSWVQMDNAAQWYISDRALTVGTTTVAANAATETEITSDSYSIQPRSDNILTVNPGENEFYLFRQSGVGATASLQVQGTDGVSVSSIGGIGGIDVILHNPQNPGNDQNGTTDSDGTVEFDDTIPGDDYEIQIPEQPGIDHPISAPAYPQFDGDSLGYITITNAEENFKISFRVGNSRFSYLGATYSFEVVITNTGSADMLSADYEIDPPPGVRLTGSNLKDILGTVRANGGSQTLSFDFTYTGDFSETFRDVPIPITISSASGHLTWNDSFLVRVYREEMDLYLRSSNAEVRGIVLGAEQTAIPFHTVTGSAVVSFPVLETPTIMAVTGAGYSSETRYAFRLNEPPSSDGSSLTTASALEPNDTELEAASVVQQRDYAAYLGVYDLDFYTLYDDWTMDPTYSISYHPNGAEGGTVPVDPNTYLAGSEFTVAENVGSLYRSGFMFSGWKTSPGISGPVYEKPQTLQIEQTDLSLYAHWASIPTYGVTYHGNGATAGDTPVDGNEYYAGETFVVHENLGTLERDGFVFSSWNEREDGSGNRHLPGESSLIPESDLSLFAQWLSKGIKVDGRYRSYGILLEDRTLWTLGENWYGILGSDVPLDGTDVQPRLIASDVEDFSIGEYTTLFAKTDGSAWATGRNSSGEFGNGTTSNSDSPVKVADDIAAVAVGTGFGVYLRQDGTAMVAGTGYGSSMNIILDEVVEIDAGTGHALFLRSDGSLWAIGSNSDGQFGSETPGSSSNAVQIASNVETMAAGMGYSLWITADGRLWATGNNTYGQLGIGSFDSVQSPVEVATGVESVSAGRVSSFYITQESTLWGFGRDWFGQLGINGELGDDSTDQPSPVVVDTDIDSVAAGSRSFLIRRDGSVWNTIVDDDRGVFARLDFGI